MVTAARVNESIQVNCNTERYGDARRYASRDSDWDACDCSSTNTRHHARQTTRDQSKNYDQESPDANQISLMILRGGW